MGNQQTDHLNDVLKRLTAEADAQLGPSTPVLAPNTVLKETARDLEILTLAQAGLTYIEIGRRLDMPLADVVRRIVAMLKGVPLYSEGHLAAYMQHQLDLIQVGIESALLDTAAQGQGDDFTEKLASTNRHNGRMGLVKLLTHQAAILGLLRQRLEIDNRTRVEIAVLRPQEYDAL